MQLFVLSWKKMKCSIVPEAMHFRTFCSTVHVDVLTSFSKLDENSNFCSALAAASSSCYNKSELSVRRKIAFHKQPQFQGCLVQQLQYFKIKLCSLQSTTDFRIFITENGWFLLVALHFVCAIYFFFALLMTGLSM